MTKPMFQQGGARVLGTVLITVLLLTTSIFLLAGTLHETGHAVTGMVMDCQHISIILFDTDTGTTFTSMQCPTTKKSTIAVGSFVLVSLFAGLFLLIRTSLYRPIGWMLLGMHVLGSASDLAYLTRAPAITNGAILAGVFFILYGEEQLVSALLDHHSTPHELAP